MNMTLKGFILTSCLGIIIQFNGIAQMNSKLDTITLGAGCFWCIEAVFQEIEGVESVISGYCNGKVKNPTYKEVCSGLTGHAEVVQVVFDTTVVNLSDILLIFWGTHDPTTLNQQGADKGTQYRSGIFYHHPQQKILAENLKKVLEEKQIFEKPIVTEITPVETFYVAENYHQDYFKLNGEQPYCKFVIQPKLDKLKKMFSDKLK